MKGGKWASSCGRCDGMGLKKPVTTPAGAPRFARPQTRLRYNQLRTKQPSRAKPTTTTTTTKRKKERKKDILNHPFYKLILNHPFYKLILNHPFCKLILNHPFCKLILNHPFFFFRGLGYSLDFFDPQLNFTLR